MNSLKKRNFVFVLIAVMSGSFSWGQGNMKDPLEDDLKSLEFKSNEIPNHKFQESMYSVKQRYSSLNKRSQLTITGGENFNSPDYMESQQYGIEYRFHFNPTWSAGLKYSQVANELNESGNLLFSREQLVNDTDYADSMTELNVQANLFYGKIRFSNQSIVYFDYYVGAGAGQVALDSGSTNSLTANTGMWMWIGSRYALQLDAKFQRYDESPLTGEKTRNNLVASLGFGVLFGKGGQ